MNTKFNLNDRVYRVTWMEGLGYRAKEYTVKEIRINGYGELYTLNSGDVYEGNSLYTKEEILNKVKQENKSMVDMLSNLQGDVIYQAKDFEVKQECPKEDVKEGRNNAKSCKCDKC